MFHGKKYIFCVLIFLLGINLELHRLVRQNEMECVNIFQPNQRTERMITNIMLFFHPITHVYLVMLGEHAIRDPNDTEAQGKNRLVLGRKPLTF
jgi:hypothetical protein